MKKIIFSALILMLAASPIVAQNSNDDWNDNTPAVTTTSEDWGDEDEWNDNEVAPTSDEWDNSDVSTPSDDWDDNEEATPAKPATEKKTGKKGGFSFGWIIAAIVAFFAFVIIKKKKSKKGDAAAPKKEKKAEAVAEKEEEETPEEEEEAEDEEEDEVPAADMIAVAPTAKYKVIVKGEKHGPYTLEQMEEFIAKGRMNRKTQVIVQGVDGVHPAGKIETLLPLLKEHGF